MKKPNWKLWLKDKDECKQWLDTYIKKNILKKTKNESEIYARQAGHNLTFANWVSERHDEIPTTYEKERFDDWIITVCYYAIYHSALALLSKEGYASKNHAATLCFLIYHHFHSQKALDEEDVELVAASLDREDIKTIGETNNEYISIQNDFKKSLKILNEDIKEPDVDTYTKIGSYNSMIGNFNEALSYYRKALDYPDISNEKISKIKTSIAILIRFDDSERHPFEKSLKLIDEAIEADPLNAEAKKIKKTLQSEILTLIYMATTGKINEEVTNPSKHFEGFRTGFSQATISITDVLTNVGIIIKKNIIEGNGIYYTFDEDYLTSNQKELLDESRKLSGESWFQAEGILMLRWAVEGGYDVKEFYDNIGDENKIKEIIRDTLMKNSYSYSGSGFESYINRYRDANYLIGEDPIKNTYMYIPKTDPNIEKRTNFYYLAVINALQKNPDIALLSGSGIKDGFQKGKSGAFQVLRKIEDKNYPPLKSLGVVNEPSGSEKITFYEKGISISTTRPKYIKYQKFGTVPIKEFATEYFIFTNPDNELYHYKGTTSSWIYWSRENFFNLMMLEELLVMSAVGEFAGLAVVSSATIDPVTASFVRTICNTRTAFVSTKVGKFFVNHPYISGFIRFGTDSLMGVGAIEVSRRVLPESIQYPAEIFLGALVNTHFASSIINKIDGNMVKSFVVRETGKPPVYYYAFNNVKEDSVKKAISIKNNIPENEVVENTMTVAGKTYKYFESGDTRFIIDKEGKLCASSFEGGTDFLYANLRTVLNSVKQRAGESEDDFINRVKAILDNNQKTKKALDSIRGAQKTIYPQRISATCCLSRVYQLYEKISDGIITGLKEGSWYLGVGSQSGRTVVSKSRQAIEKALDEPMYLGKMKIDNNGKIIELEPTKEITGNAKDATRKALKSAVEANGYGVNTKGSLCIIPPTSAGCFLAGTKIQTAEGSYKNIEDISKGENVKAFDISKDNPANAEVTTTFVRPETKYKVVEYETEE